MECQFFLFFFVRACTKIATGSSQYSGGGTKTVNMFAKLMSQGSSFVMEGVKNLVVKKHVSRIIRKQNDKINLLETLRICP
jgi:hypothetical protein